MISVDSDFVHTYVDKTTTVTDISRSPVWTTVGVVVCVNIGVENIAVMDIMRQPVWTTVGDSCCLCHTYVDTNIADTYSSPYHDIRDSDGHTYVDTYSSPHYCR